MTGKGKGGKKKWKKSVASRLENLQDIDLQSVVENLQSDRIELQAPAVEQAIEIADVLAIEAVDALRRGPERFPIAERILGFGSIALPHVEKLFRESKDSEVKLLSALTLLGLESKEGVPYLLDAALTPEGYGFIAPLYLAKAKVEEAIEPILIRLRRFDFHNIDLQDSKTITEIGLLLGSLEILEADIPPDLCEQLSHPNVPEIINKHFQDIQRQMRGRSRKRARVRSK